MTENTHTPGPWKAAADGTRGFDILTDDDAALTVARVFGENSEVGECEPGQAMSDAQLIASAPELLAACEALQNEYTRLANSIDHCSNDWRGMYKVHAAIAKAKGGA